MNHNIKAVIGRGFGDEGKGLATDFLCLNVPDSVVIKHNGGAQAGHSVDLPDGRRFVFHQLGSGSLRHADTLWADSFFPDLYKLREEYDSFISAAGFRPVIYSDPMACSTLITDVLLNLSVESLRGKSRHGSCGMGINEADLRVKAGFPVTVSDIISWSHNELYGRMLEIRNEYYPLRFKELGIDKLPGDYSELFFSDDVLYNAAKAMKENAGLLNLLPQNELIKSRCSIIFESGQGLLLDAMCERYYPHVTASRTGLTNIMRILNDCGLPLNEVIYVARSYVTRHGAGPLPNEVTRESINPGIHDITNLPNPWQGTLRYGLYESIDSLLAPIKEDLDVNAGNILKKSLLITHLNETSGVIRCKDNDMSVDEFASLSLQSFLDGIYTSYTPYAQDIR